MPNCIFVLSLLFNSLFSCCLWADFRDAHKEAEALSRADVERSLGALKQEQAEMAEKLKVANQARLSVEAGLKIVESQAENQR